MLKFKKLTFLASLFMVGMLLLAACGAEEPTQAPAEEAIDTQATVEAAEAAAAEEAAQATVEAAEAAAAAEAEEEMTEEPNVAADTESSSENLVPTIPSEVPRISAQELKERLDNGDAIAVADTRQEYLYDAKHITGAISVPSLLAESPLDELPLDHEIVLYCT
jgi:ABC-type glycerol-3-phosphate transport system substrate-binding protein